MILLGGHQQKLRDWIDHRPLGRHCHVSDAGGGLESPLMRSRMPYLEGSLVETSVLGAPLVKNMHSTQSQNNRAAQRTRVGRFL